MISIIICSVNPGLVASFSENVKNTIGVPFEIIVIDNRILNEGICRVYNKGAERAKFGILCFAHEDILFHTDLWGVKLMKAFEDVSVGLIGACGAKCKSHVPSMWVDVSTRYYVCNQFFPEDTEKKELYLSREISDNEVAVIDGLFMATTKEIWKQHKFNEEIEGFHFYDIDYSLNVGLDKKLIVAKDIVIEHLSRGKRDKNWLLMAIQYHDTYQKLLPRFVGDFSVKDQKEVEFSCRLAFHRMLMKYKMPARLLLQNYINIIRLKPVSRLHFRTIKDVLTRLSENSAYKQAGIQDLSFGSIYMSKQKRVRLSVIFTKSGGVGGSEILALKIIERALMEGLEVQLSFYGPAFHSDETIKKLKSKSLLIHEIYMPDTGSLPGKVIFHLNKNKELFPLFRGIKKFNPDVILISQGGTYDLSFNLPLSGFLMNLEKPFYIISQFHFENGAFEYSVIKRARAIFETARKVFFVSRRNFETAQMILASNISNGMVINNPVKFENKEGLPFPQSDEIQFGCVARLDARIKGQNILLKALSADNWKARNWALNFYGTGQDLQYLQELTRFYQLEDKVKFHGFVQEVKHVWKKNHILVMPTLAEGTPLSLIEASICGRASVVTDVGGNADLVIDGKTGYLAPSNSVKEFGRTLERAWEDRQNWERMGVLAREHLLASIDVDIENKLLQLITNPDN